MPEYIPDIPEYRKVVNFLADNAGTLFTATEIANAIVKQYPLEYGEIRKNPRYPEGERGDKIFISQIAAQIGALRIKFQEPVLIFFGETNQALVFTGMNLI